MKRVIAARLILPQREPQSRGIKMPGNNDAISEFQII